MFVAWSAIRSSAERPVQDRRDEPELAGHRRLEGQQRQRVVVDPQVQVIDPVVVLDHATREGLVAAHEGVDRAGDRLPGELAEAQEVELELLEALVELSAGHPNRPVT
ncbi:MAG: hypothetical protein KatS3mg013_2114 [Actinomycetota bacterium]|nr:MAG: hypothetical protein KatS3mg013_2114 [Actinomycetota bacterium]